MKADLTLLRKLCLDSGVRIRWVATRAECQALIQDRIIYVLSPASGSEEEVTVIGLHELGHIETFRQAIYDFSYEIQMIARSGGDPSKIRGSSRF